MATRTQLLPELTIHEEQCTLVVAHWEGQQVVEQCRVGQQLPAQTLGTGRIFQLEVLKTVFDNTVPEGVTTRLQHCVEVTILEVQTNFIVAYFYQLRFLAESLIIQQNTEVYRDGYPLGTRLEQELLTPTQPVLART